MFRFQRLSAPRPSASTPGIKPHHVFGGAALGLKPEAWAILDSLCTLDHMGAGEYEDGELPRFLSAWAQAPGDLRGFIFQLRPGEYETQWMRRAGRNDVHARPPLGRLRHHAIFGIVRARDETSERRAEQVFRAVAKGDVWVKGGAHISAALDPERTSQPPYPLRTDGPKGWIALDHDAMFFVDEVMWRGFAALFRVDLHALQPPPPPEPPDYHHWRKPDLAAVAVVEGIVGSRSAAMAMRREDLLQILFREE